MREGGLGVASLACSLHAAYVACSLEVLGCGLAERSHILGLDGRHVSIEKALSMVPELEASLDWMWSHGSALSYDCTENSLSFSRFDGK